MGLSITIVTGPRQRSHSRVRIPAGLVIIIIIVSDSRLVQPEGPGPRIYIAQEQGCPVITPGTGSLFVASYDSQGYDGGIRTRLCTGFRVLVLSGTML
jgi:hypothetical protein